MLCDAGVLVHDCVALVAVEGPAALAGACCLSTHIVACTLHVLPMLALGKPMGSACMHLLLPHVGGMSLKWKSQWALRLQQTPCHATGLHLP